MSTPADPSTRTDMCNACGKYFPRAQMRRCSACHAVKYCSRACQKATWARHRVSCARLAQVREEYALPENSEIRREADTIMKWYAVWHYALGRYGMLAMDLANHGIERLKDSALYLELAFVHPKPAERSRWLTLQDGRIMPRTELATRLPASQMAELAQDPETARPRVMLLVVLASGGHLIPYKVGFPLEFVRECQADRALSRAAAEMWLPVLQGMIAQGLVPP